MTAFPLGRVNVSIGGQAIRLATTSTPCCRIRAQVIAGLTGKMYLGTAGLNRVTMAGVIKEFWPNQSGGIDDQWEVWSDGDELDLSQYYIDAFVSGEGVLITYWQT
jgi:hypothetical protein